MVKETGTKAYLQIVVEEIEAVRATNSAGTTDTFSIQISATSKDPISDFRAIQSQIRIALNMLIDESLKSPVIKNQPPKLDEIFSEIRPILAELSLGEKRVPGRRQVRVDRIWNAFKSSKKNIVPLSVLAEQFSETSDPEKSATSMIGWINRWLAKGKSKFEIKRVSYYEFRERERSTKTKRFG
ncbi:MAG: hypothetical protein WEE20_06105 [Bacteroidota bacterium]